MSGLYTDPLLTLSRETRWARLPADAARATAHNPLCGDEITVAARVLDGAVLDLGFVAHACAVCNAAATAMCDVIAGAPLSAVDAHRAALSRTVRSGEAESDALTPFAALAAHPSRAACAELPWKALQAALAAPRASRVHQSTAARQASAQAPERVSERAPEPVLATLDDWARVQRLLAEGRRCAIATLTAVVGSSPCPLGSRMIVRDDGHFWGSVSGGCVESAVVQAALTLLDDPAGPQSASADYQIANSQAGAVGLPCGGRVTVHVALAPDIEQVAAIRAAHETGAVRVLSLTDGACHIARAGAGPLSEAIDAVLASERPLQVDEPTPVFVEPLRSPPRLVLIGGTHIAQKLCRMAVEAGFAPIVVEPRADWARPGRFADATVVRERAERVLPGLIDSRTAVVTLTHERLLDDPALKVALASPAFYIGALGSRRTQQARLARLADDGVPPAQLARLHGPAGLPIDGKGAGEIALSILAEIVATRRRVERPRRVGAVVLAAGSSRRAGPINKLLHPIDGAPMVRHAVRAALDAEVEPVLVVLGHEAERVRAALADLPVRFVHNAEHAAGMGRSIACGIAALAERTAEPPVDAALVMLGDMPYVRAEDIARIVAAHRASTRHLIAAPEAGEGAARRRGNPVLWPRRYFAALQRLEGDAGGRHILQGAPGAILRVPIDHPGVLRDVDAP